MIASLKGKITHIFPNFVIVDVNGVGYRVEGVSLLETGIEVSLFVYTHYSQQETRLFGFNDKDSYLLFHDLITVPGVGPKTASGLINFIGVNSIKSAILSNDPKSLTGNGVGLKSAQKIILELASKIEKSGFTIDKKIVSNSTQFSKPRLEVEQALVGLGYSKIEVEDAFKNIEIEAEISSEKLLRKMLSRLASIK